MKGHASEIDEKGFKAGDRLKLALHAETTDKLLLLSTGGRSIRWAATSCRAGAGRASRCGSWSISRKARISSICSSIGRARSG
jgi:hypothetical protein